MGRENLLKSQVDPWKIHLTWRSGIYVKGLDRKVSKVWYKKGIFLSFHPTDHKISRLSQYKNSGELAVLFLRQFDVPISWKERLFYLQRDYAIFVSLQCIDFRPTDYEGFETEPTLVWSRSRPCFPIKFLRNVFHYIETSQSICEEH